MKEEIKGIVYVCIITLIVIFLFNYFDNILNLNNKNLIKYLNNSYDYINISDSKSNLKFLNELNIVNLVNNNYNNITFLNDKELLNKYNEDKNSITKETETVLKEEKDIVSINSPIVYIYNTHNKEQYNYDKNAPYNIIPTVVSTSYMLKESLSKNNIGSIVEETDVSQILKKNKWNYSSSYKASRLLIESAVKNNTTLNFFIDVHRDSASYETTTIEINKEKYARVLFILGLENKDYLKNLKMIEYINNEINKNYKGLTRGILKKKGKGVNGVYNQDFSPNTILIEFGGKDNTIDEVFNTTKVVGKIISKYIGDYNENE